MERFEALLGADIKEHAFSFHGAGRKCHGSNMRISNGGSSLDGNEELI
jgi:hypothetical protein